MKSSGMKRVSDVALGAIMKTNRMNEQEQHSRTTTTDRWRSRVYNKSRAEEKRQVKCDVWKTLLRRDNRVSNYQFINTQKKILCAHYPPDTHTLILLYFLLLCSSKIHPFNHKKKKDNQWQNFVKKKCCRRNYAGGG